jgi:hypothetical protein
VYGIRLVDRTSDSGIGIYGYKVWGLGLVERTEWFWV